MFKIDELYELAVNRRSIRGYDKSRDVPDEMVQRFLDCARWAPSGGNGQPWEFIVVRDEKTRHEIADLRDTTWRSTETIGSFKNSL